MDLKITSDQDGTYEFDGEQFMITQVSAVLGFFNVGYLGFFEQQLRYHLYEKFEPLGVTFVEDQLVLSGINSDVRIVLIN